jgi:hypothetical protein
MRLLWLPIGIILCSLLAGLGRPTTPQRLSAAATHFLDSLRTDLRAKAALPFEHPGRTDWHYVPRDRPGLRLRDMNDTERTAAHELLRAALSSRGYLKADSIMQLDQVLRDLSKAAGHEDPGRDPLQYTFTIFGTPGGDHPWSWRVEGHHVSLNFTITPQSLTATTPAFFGSAPTLVQSGPHSGFRALAAEDDLGRELLASFDAEQLKKVIIEKEVPRDIVMSPGRKRDELGEPIGLAAKEMTEVQRGKLMRLIEEYARNLQDDLAEEQLSRMRENADAIRFAWFGSSEPGKLHYYRVHGPRFIIEYDTTQGDPNHVHTVWRDLERDFGQDLLKDHYEHDHH